MQNQSQRGQGNTKGRGQSEGGTKATGSSGTKNAGRMDADMMDETETKETGMKSIGAVIGENLAKGTQERVDQAMDTVNGYVTSVKNYVTENPKEAAALGAAIGLAAWALLYTKPGRQLFDKGAEVIVPQVSNWVTSTFSGSAAGASGQTAKH